MKMAQKIGPEPMKRPSRVPFKHYLFVPEGPAPDHPEGQPGNAGRRARDSPPPRKAAPGAPALKPRYKARKAKKKTSRESR